MTRQKKLATAIAALLLAHGLASQTQAAGRSDLVLAALNKNIPHVPDEVLVQFRPGISAARKGRALGQVGAESQELLVESEWRTDGKGDLELVTVPPGLGIAAAVRSLEAAPEVEFAEPNWIYQHMKRPAPDPQPMPPDGPSTESVPNDPYYTLGNLWGMYGDQTSPANQYGSQAGEAWAAGNTNCNTVFVGIIDEGYMYSHEDLAANAGTNPGEIPGNGKDDDGNGYKDDVYGWDFVGRNNTVFDGIADDHGTHVAGTIGAVGGNGKGVAGVCWSIKLMDAKFLGTSGGTLANAIKAVDYFTDLKVRNGLNLVATNNSWGGGGYSQGLKDAIDRAGAKDILFVAAAGNSTYNCDTSSACYPAEYDSDNVIAVAAITSNGGLASFSNFGATTVDLGAPGYGIWSTVPTKSGRTVVSGYASYSGTSMATPHVTGAAALYAATHSVVSAAAIKSAILSRAIPTSSLSGKTVTGGRLDVSGF